MSEANKDRFSYWVESFTTQIEAWKNIKEEASTEADKKAAFQMIDGYKEALDFLNSQVIGKDEQTQVTQIIAFCEAHEGLRFSGIVRCLRETAWDIQLQHTGGVSGPDAVWRD